MKGRHFYKEPDVSKRKVSDRFGDGESKVITHPNGLYNPNLTIGELCLLRTLIHELQTSMQDGSTYILEVLPVLHKWLFAKEAPEILIYLDIKQDFENGTKIDFDK